MSADVQSLGQDVDVVVDGEVESHDGTWLAGEEGARFGLRMPGTPLLGARYQLEIAPDVAIVRAEVVGLAETVVTPAGRFERCLLTAETTPLGRVTRHRAYARGVGLVRDGVLRLVRHGP